MRRQPPPAAVPHPDAVPEPQTLRRVREDTLAESPGSEAAAEHLRKWVTWCYADMQTRRQNGEAIAADDYLTGESHDPLPAEVAVDLIYAEYAIRQAYGEAVDGRELLRRFPAYAPQLQRQLDLDTALLSADRTVADTLAHDSSNPSNTWSRDSHEGASRAPASRDDGAPERIGKYLVVAHLATGGQAVVYRALHPGLSKEVVLKLARRDTPQAAAHQRQIAAEGRILASLDHPHLARVYDLDFHENRLFLVSEYVRGRTLEQLSQHAPLAPQKAALLVAKLARGLAAAHRQGVVHLDVKPRNIVVDERGEPRLIDFALAMLQDSFAGARNEPAALRGTLQFMSPEQARAESQSWDHRADLFGLGAVLYFLLTGHPPYPPGTLGEVLPLARQGGWDRAALESSAAPRELQGICAHAMALDPKERFASGDDLADALERFAVGGKGRRRLAVAVAGFAIVVLCALGAAAFGRRWFSSPPAHPVAQPTAKIVGPLLAVEVWNEGRYLPLVESLPTRNGDLFRLQASVPAGMYGALYAFTSATEFKRLADVPPERADRTLRFPMQPGKAAPLTGPPGTEVLLLCLSENAIALGAPAEVLAEPWIELPEASCLVADPEGVQVLQSDRDFGEPVEQFDPEDIVRERLQTLRAWLAPRTAYFEAVAFRHAP